MLNGKAFFLGAALIGLSAVPLAAKCPGGLAEDGGASDMQDFNCDGKSDLFFRYQPANTSASDYWKHVVWFMNGTTRIGSGTIAPTPASTPGNRQLLVGVADFNNDNEADLLLQRESSREVEFWIMNGTTRVGSPVPLAGTPLAPEWQIAATADFNRDGCPDILWQNTTTHKLLIWTLSGTTKSGEIVPDPDQAVDANWSVIAARDFGNGQENGDHPSPAPDRKPDLLWRNSTSGKLVVWFMNNSVQRIVGRFTNPDGPVDANWTGVFGSDLGAGPGGISGTNDLVFRNEVSGRLVVWHLDNAINRTAGVFTCPVAPGSSSSCNPADPTPADAADWTLVGPR